MNYVKITVRTTSIAHERADELTGRKCSIFRGLVVNNFGYDNFKIDERISIKADWGVCRYRIFVGQLWTADGPFGYYYDNINRWRKKIKQIIAKSLKAEQSYGDNIVQWIDQNRNIIGIGENTARHLVLCFGKKLYSILRNKDRQAILNTGFIRRPQYLDTLFDEFQKFDYPFVMQALDEFGISAGVGRQVIQVYEGDTINALKDNPYILGRFMRKWKNYDRIVLDKYSMDLEDQRRLLSMIDVAAFKIYDSGNTLTTKDEILIKIKSLLADARRTFSEQKHQYQNSLAYQAVKIASKTNALIENGEYFHLSGGYLMELSILLKIWRMNHKESRSIVSQEKIQKKIENFEKFSGFSLTHDQKSAIRCSLIAGASIIMGGAGTGKTTILKVICDILKECGRQVIQMALAGRAMQRMREATSHKDTFTIHRFNQLCESGRISNLCNTTVIVDESSMCDLAKLCSVFESLPKGAQIIMVGDQFQLPPIGPGIVFHALADSNFLPKSELTVIQRQKESSGIPSTGAAIREHYWPKHQIPYYKGRSVGVVIAPCSQSDCSKMVMDIFGELGGLEESEDVQILSAYNYGQDGVHQLNSALQVKFGDRRVVNQVQYKDRNYDYAGGSLSFNLFVGDKIIITRNIYSLQIFNGMLGLIIAVNQEYEPNKSLYEKPGTYGVVKICIDDGRELWLDNSHLDAVQLGYAITVHKAQGSQFKRVIFPIRKKVAKGEISMRKNLYDQSLVYTAITRAIEQVVLVGDIETLIKAVETPSLASRRNVGIKYMFEMDYSSIDKGIYYGSIN